MKKNILTVLFAFTLLFFTVSCSGAANQEPLERVRVKYYGSGDLSIHFLELGNKFTGDCVYINYGEVDIIIDAGSRRSSATAIIEYIDNHIQDNKIEFIIATHAHQDHIAAFHSTSSVKGILDTYEIETIIDFPKTNSTTATYNNYRNTRERLKENGTYHYTALQCYRETNGAQRVYDLGGDVQLEILYNPYYETYSSNENNYSVCVKIIQGDKQYIFTGDLEEEGENYMVDYYAANHGGLGQCVLYKGGHHGSDTSSHAKLMAAIMPDYVCVCTCAGTYEYSFNVERNRFPSQGFIDRVAPYTDEVYITTLIIDYPNNLYESFNGDIVFLVSDSIISINCSNNNLKLKETEWFLNNKTMPDAWKPKEILELVSLAE